MKLSQQRTLLERLARRQWVLWGDRAKYTVCSECGEMAHCRARRPRGPWLCLECWDVHPEAERDPWPYSEQQPVV